MRRSASLLLLIVLFGGAAAEATKRSFVKGVRRTQAKEKAPGGEPKLPVVEKAKDPSVEPNNNEQAPAPSSPPVLTPSTDSSTTPPTGSTPEEVLTTHTDTTAQDPTNAPGPPLDVPEATAPATPVVDATTNDGGEAITAPEPAPALAPAPAPAPAPSPDGTDTTGPTSPGEFTQNDRKPDEDDGKPPPRPSPKGTPSPASVPETSEPGETIQQDNGDNGQLNQDKNDKDQNDGPAFCRAPDEEPDDDHLETCRHDHDEWKELEELHSISFHHRHFTGECGPNCRPSCVTLLLDLNKFHYERDLQCQADELCQCQFHKCNNCTSNDRAHFLIDHPQCYLEEADCLGPVVYDDTVYYMEKLAAFNNIPFNPPKRCTAIPDDEMYCRFQDWQVVHPLEDFSSCDVCVQRENKVYFEYCNIVEEDHDNCRDDKCETDHKRVVEPFNEGWTTFVVSASIPYPYTIANEDCNDLLEYEELTDHACFLERIEIYYPPLDVNCTQGCPHCHDCPLLSLGDMFGPLEVVGFGYELHYDNNHEGHHTCSACDKRSDLPCAKDLRELDCEHLFACDELVNCATGESLGIPDFVENHCSFCNNTDMFERNQNAGTNGGTGYRSSSRTGGGLAAGASTPIQNVPDDSSRARHILLTMTVEICIAALIVGAVYATRKKRQRSRVEQEAPKVEPERDNESETGDDWLKWWATGAWMNLTSAIDNPPDGGDDDKSQASNTDESVSSNASAMSPSGLRTYHSTAVMETEGDEDIEAIDITGESSL